MFWLQFIQTRQSLAGEASWTNISIESVDAIFDKAIDCDNAGSELVFFIAKDFLQSGDGSSCPSPFGRVDYYRASSYARKLKMPLKILVVEDDPLVLELMSEIIASFDADVRPIGDSEAAAALVERERFDGIFLDLQMPKLNGFQLAGKIRQSPSNRSTPIVVVTGHDDNKIMAQAFAVGGTLFLQKPVDRPKLVKLFKIARGIMFENQRRYIRVPLQIEVTCECGGKPTKGTSINISEGGILVETSNFAGTGNNVLITFRLPAQNSPCSLGGTIIWTDEKRTRTGVQFTSITPKDKQSIRDFITSYLS